MTTLAIVAVILFGIGCAAFVGINVTVGKKGER